MRNILIIEYEYTRKIILLSAMMCMRCRLLMDGFLPGLYVNSLALQAVVDRWTTISHEAATGQAQANKPQQTGASSSSWWLGVLMDLYQTNEQYIQEVVDASRRILRTLLEGLVPGDQLKHAPVRTYFRILSGMIFILKVGFWNFSNLFLKMLAWDERGPTAAGAGLRGQSITENGS